MKKIVTLFGLLWALCAGATNITNYPVRTTFNGNYWFLLSDVAAQTNWNLPGNYVASTLDLNTASNILWTYMYNSSNSLWIYIGGTSNYVNTVSNNLFTIISAPTNVFILNTTNWATGISNTFNGKTYMNDSLYVTTTNPSSILYDLGVSTLTSTNGITNTTLTISSLMASDVNNREVSVANGTGILTDDGAGGFSWVPVSSLVVTNPPDSFYTNLYVKNLYGTNITTQQVDYYTNAVATCDFSKGYGWTNVSAAFKFPDPINKDATGTKAQTCVVLVTNSSGAAIAITAPDNTHIVPGSVMYVTNVTAFTFFLYPTAMTNVYGVPLF